APEGDVRAYLVALRRLHARGPERLRPGHGPEITDPRATLARLVAHRNDRERAVLDAVRAGNATPDAVTDAAYDKDVSAVRDLARATVVAHIEKLAAERRVRWDPEAERVEPR
ncbi:putative metallo-beta-lactamase family hydrolase, partial [Haloferax sp. BAB-2207]